MNCVRKCFLSFLSQRLQEKELGFIFLFGYVMKHFVSENIISRETKRCFLKTLFHKGFCMPSFVPKVKLIGKTAISKLLQCTKCKQRTQQEERNWGKIGSDPFMKKSFFSLFSLQVCKKVRVPLQYKIIKYSSRQIACHHLSPYLSCEK